MPRKADPNKPRRDQIKLYGDDLYDIEKWRPNIINLINWQYPYLTPDNKEDLVQSVLYKLLKYNFPHKIRQKHTFSVLGSYIWSVLRNQFLSDFYTKKYKFLVEAMEQDETLYHDTGYTPEYEDELQESMICDPFIALQYELLQEDPKKFYKTASQETKRRIAEYFDVIMPEDDPKNDNTKD